MTTRKLLIVDDEPNFGDYVRRVAEGVGFEVQVTENGRDFTRAFEDDEPDVIVMDMVMPEMEGSEIIMWLAERGCTAHLIIVTGYNPNYARTAKVLGQAKGMSSVVALTKPVRAQALRDALNATFDDAASVNA